MILETNNTDPIKEVKEMTKYESIIRAISMMMINREYVKASHHIERIWNRQDDMTDTEIEVLRALAMNKHIKF